MSRHTCPKCGTSFAEAILSERDEAPKTGKKAGSELEAYFAKLRFHPKFHLGLGDIRISLGQQEEIVAMVQAGDA